MTLAGSGISFPCHMLEVSNRQAETRNNIRATSSRGGASFRPLVSKYFTENSFCLLFSNRRNCKLVLDQLNYIYIIVYADGRQ